MKKFLTMFLIILLCVSAFSGCDNVLPQNGGSQTTDDTLNTNVECEHNWERIGNLNESTAQDKCTKCGETRLYTDPDSLSGNRLLYAMTIAETLPSCVVFEYKDEKPYCFYAYNTEGKLCRVFWNDFAGLNEKDIIAVEFDEGDFKVLSYDEYPGGGWTPQYEITATNVYTTDNGINDHIPYDSMLNLEIINGKFRFQRIATTPCIVYSNAPINDMSKGTMYDDRHDILTAVFRATDGKDAIMDTTECEFLHYIYMFDNEREDVPWHYRFAICSCGAVMITNNNQFLCTIKISDDELRTILDAFDTSEEDHEIPNDPDSFKTLYTVEITNSENYPILNELKASYRMGEKVTIELETITEHYYVLYVNGVEQSPDETGTNDWSVTCYTFSMPAENVIITIEDRWVDIPENSQGTGQQEECEHDWERIGNLNESTAQDRCTKCGETRLYTDPDSIDKPSDQQVAAPVDFAIHFETWIDGSQRNILDTYEGYIQKDLISDGISKKDYNPSYVELCQLYQFVLALEHRTELDYSKPVTYDNYADDEISVSMDPLTCYYLKFTANGKTIEISGDATANECTDQSEEAQIFVGAIRGIGNFYRNTDVYKTMPNANGGYE